MARTWLQGQDTYEHSGTDDMATMTLAAHIRIIEVGYDAWAEEHDETKGGFRLTVLRNRALARGNR